MLQHRRGTGGTHRQFRAHGKRTSQQRPPIPHLAFLIFNMDVGGGGGRRHLLEGYSLNDLQSRVPLQDKGGWRLRLDLGRQSMPSIKRPKLPTCNRNVEGRLQLLHVVNISFRLIEQNA